MHRRVAVHEGADEAVSYYTCQFCGIQSTDKDFIATLHDAHGPQCRRHVQGYTFDQARMLRARPAERSSRPELQPRTPSVGRGVDGFFKLHPKAAVLTIALLFLGLPLLLLAALPTSSSPAPPRAAPRQQGHYARHRFIDRVESEMERMMVKASCVIGRIRKDRARLESEVADAEAPWADPTVPLLLPPS